MNRHNAKLVVLMICIPSIVVCLLVLILGGIYLHQKQQVDISNTQMSIATDISIVTTVSTSDTVTTQEEETFSSETSAITISMAETTVLQTETSLTTVIIEETITSEKITEAANVECPYDYEQKLEVVSSGSSARLSLYEWNNDWVLLWSTDGYVGKDGVSSASREGSAMTPAGTFKIGFAYGITPVNTNLNFITLSPNSVWVDDPKSSYYNVLTTSDLAGSAHYEKTYDQFVNGIYSTNIYFENNGDGLTAGTATPNAGSVITLCGYNRTLEPTAGCVDISSVAMSELLQCLDAEKNPVICIS